MSELNSYNLSRAFFDFSFENPHKIKPIHGAIYFFAIEHCNRLGWKEEFGFPTNMVMETIGVKNYRTYIKAFDELVEWGAIKVIERSTNQYTANIIALVKITKATTKALDKALIKQGTKQSTEQVQSIDSGTVSIDKPINKEPINKEQVTIWPSFDDFWEAYDKKTDSKSKVEKKWNSLSQKTKESIMDHLPDYVASTPDKNFRKNPSTYLNNEGWTHEIINKHEQGFTETLATHLAANDPDWKNY